MLNKKRGMLNKGLASMPEMPPQQPSMSIDKAHKGGYIARSRGKEGYSSEKQTVHSNLAQLIKHMKAHFGEAEGAEGEGGQGGAG